MEARKTKITGSRLKDIVVLRGTGKKLGFYELIAERLALPHDEEISPMDRGSELEKTAIERFEKETGKKVNTDKVIWVRDDNESIAVSPDGSVENAPEAVEVKCLASARHIEALLTKEIPKDYDFQVLQYFIVNDKLEKLHFVFFDPELSVKEFFYYTIDRASVQARVDEYLAYERATIAEVNEIVNSLSF